MQLPADRAVTVRFRDGKELTVTVRESDPLGIQVESAECQRGRSQSRGAPSIRSADSNP
jgi:hypothetical protein